MVLARCEYCRFSFEAPEPPAPVACHQCGRPASRLQQNPSLGAANVHLHGKTQKVRVIESPALLPVLKPAKPPEDSPDKDSPDEDK